MSDELAAFLRARLDEDEHVAGLVVNGPGEAPMLGLNPLRVEVDGDVRHAYVSAHPARVLADVEAKRRIVERHARCGTGSGYCDDGGHGWDEGDVLGCADLADLALPYADHADFHEEWRP